MSFKTKSRDRIIKPPTQPAVIPDRPGSELLVNKLRRNASKPRGQTVPKLLTVETAADFYGLDERWIRRRLAMGLLPHRRFSGRIVFITEELEKFFAEDLPGTTLDEAKDNLRRRNGGEKEQR